MGERKFTLVKRIVSAALIAVLVFTSADFSVLAAEEENVSPSETLTAESAAEEESASPSEAPAAEEEKKAADDKQEFESVPVEENAEEKKTAENASETETNDNSTETEPVSSETESTVAEGSEFAADEGSEAADTPLITPGEKTTVLEDAKSGNYETAWFPAPTMNVSQIAYESASHSGMNAFDILPGGRVFAPFTGKIVNKVERYGFVVLQSTEEVYYADGSRGYMTVGFMHDNDISDLAYGQIIRQGEAFYDQGLKGGGTGEHVQISVLRGKANFTSSYSKGDVYAYDAFAINRDRTLIDGKSHFGKLNPVNHLTQGSNTDWKDLWRYTDSPAPTGPSTLAISGHTAPGNGNIQIGARWICNGTVSSNYMINEVSGYILKSDNSTSVYSKTVNPNAKSYSLPNSAIDIAMLFNMLPEGYYRYKITAKDASMSSAQELFNTEFTVGNPAPLAPEDSTAPTVSSVTVTNTGSELYFNADASDDTGITEAWMVAKGDDGAEHRFAATVSGNKISGTWKAGYFSSSNKIEVTVYAKDAAGNIGSSSMIITPTEKPSIPDDKDDSQYPDAERTDLQAAEGTISAIRAKLYDGIPYTPAVRVTIRENGKKKTLTEGFDYRVVYINNTNAGTGTVKVRGNGAYKGEITADFTINPKPIKRLRILAGSLAAKSADVIPVCVYDGSKLLASGIDYDLSQLPSLDSYVNKNVSVTLTGKGNYSGTAAVKLPVYDAEASQIIGADNVTLKYARTDYTGKAIKDNEPTVKVGDKTLVYNKDYRVQYQNNINAGTAFVIVTGKGEYKGRAVKTFEIAPPQMKLTVAPIRTQIYSGKLYKPSVRVTASGKRLAANRDYTLVYINNLHAGTDTAKVIVTGIGNYAGLSGEASFSIMQQQISKASVKGTKAALTVTYGGKILKEGVHYEAFYDESSVKNNKIEVTITGKGDFTGSVTKKVRVQ